MSSVQANGARPASRQQGTAAGRLDNARLMKIATYCSVGVTSFLIVVKAIAYAHTHSVALLTSLVDSLLDVAASTVNLLAVRHALQPADDDHRFGHGKAEALAGLAQALLISGSAIFLLIEASQRFYHPRAVEQPGLGVIVMLVSLLLTAGLVTFQRYVVRQTGSLAVSADSLHYVTDILANGSVILALLIVSYFEWPYADPLFAIVITLYIVHSAWSIISQAFQQLMDRELPDPDRDCIRTIALSHPYVSNLHDLRTRTAGQTRFIQFHLEMRHDLTLAQAHAVSEQVEFQLLRVYPDAEILVHVDPVQS